LRRELVALRQAEWAMRAGQPSRALATLEAFEREAEGQGKMHEERAAAAALARCALAADSGESLYAKFVSRYPGSAYAARLRRACIPAP